MDWLKFIFAALPVILHWSIVLGLGTRIILSRRDIGTSLAWLTLVAIFPFIGAGLYLLIGELWLARSRVRRTIIAGQQFDTQVKDLLPHETELWSHELDVDRTLNAYATRGLGIPTLQGNRITLFSKAHATFDAMVRDIDNATHTCHLLFYIWCPGGKADHIIEALIRARSRGVTCIVLLDAVGSRPFLNSPHAQTLRNAGVEVATALPVGRLRSILERIDLRNHRKIVAIDGRVAYCGSLNLADPAFFKQNAKVGEWIDIMARVEGPAARMLDLTILHDWYVETGRLELPRDEPIDWKEIEGKGSPLSVISSGPGQWPRATQDMILAMLYGARKEIIITTPYFVPGDIMMNALITAARCGVSVRVVLPAKVDSKLVRYASRAYFDDLLQEGIEVLLFRSGLLHAKTVTVDRSVALLGSANMDRRSFSVNFETSMFIYDDAVTERIRDLQLEYIADADSIDAAIWSRRHTGVRLVENAAQLLSPLL